MLFSRSWLAEYVDLPDGSQDLARRLTAAGLNVEGVEEKGDDVLLNIEVTTNRPDAMNHLGIAREAAVLYNRPLRRPPSDPSEGSERVEDAASVHVADDDRDFGCPRYVARVVRGVKVGPSSDWLRKRLEAIGLRSINNVVDVTNFILWEMGQPLHAFDLAKLAGHKIVVRRAREGEMLTTLDGVERKLDPEMLVIADAERPVALAGIMGGADSEVTEATTDILIESAHFDRKRVRLTARRLGMHTDASHRFERGTDPKACLAAASRAARLIAEVAGGTVLAGAIDDDSELFEPLRGRLELARLNAFAGAEIPAANVERWLTGLGFGLENAGDGTWDVTVPSWRFFDFLPGPGRGPIYEADVFEEILRIYGLDNIEATLPRLTGADEPRTPLQKLRDRIRFYLSAAGYAEAIHFAFHSREMDARFPSLRPGTEPLALANPLSEAYSVLRRSLIPDLVETARFNQRRGLPAVRLFELGTAFFENPGAPLPDQPEQLGLVCGGTVGTSWEHAMELDFFDLKGAVEGLAGALGVTLEARPAELPGLLAGNTAELVRPDRDDEVVGYLGRVEEEEGYPIYVAEIALDGLTGGEGNLGVDLPSRYPGISADFTLTHSLDVPWAEIDRAVAGLRPADLISWGLKIRYRGQGVPEGAVNTTVSFLYNSGERSLTQEEVNERQAALTGELERRFGWRG